MSSNFTFINDECVEVYKGSNYDKKCKKSKRVMVFDLDETLGSFGDLYILWSGVKHIHKNFEQFDKLLDLYPEFFRYGIMTILEFLYEKKKTKELLEVDDVR